MYILDYYWENSEIYFLRCLHIYRNIYYIVLVSHTHATRTEDSKNKQRVDIIWIIYKCFENNWSRNDFYPAPHSEFIFRNTAVVYLEWSQLLILLPQ